MREISRGCSSLEKLCGFSNLSPTMHVGTFTEAEKNMRDAIKPVALDLRSDRQINRCQH